MASRITLGNLTIDRERFMVWIEGAEVEVTFVEFELLYTLARNQERVTTRQALARTVWKDPTDDQARNLNVHISRLRKKLRRSRPYNIRTVPKRGYSLTNMDESPSLPEVTTHGKRATAAP